MRRNATFSFIVVVIGLVGANSSHADTISTWTGGLGNWSTAADWTPPAVPNNSAGTKYAATIGSSGTTTLDISPTIDSLALDGTLMGPSSGPAPLLTVVKGATISGDLLFGFGGEFYEPPQLTPASLSVGGDLKIGSSGLFIVGNQSVKVGGNFTNASPLSQVLYSATGTDVFRVSGTLTNQPSSVLFLGLGRCFGAGCGYLQPPYGPLRPAIGPTTSIGTLVNKGQLFSWSVTTASALVNYGSTTFIEGSTDVRSVKNGGTITLSNSCCSIAQEETVGLNVGTATTRFGYNQSANGVLDELLLGSSSYGTIAAGPWRIPPVGQEVGYPVSLNGTLDIMLRNGFSPTIGESFTIFTFAPGFLSGTFSNIEWDAFDHGLGRFLVSYNNSAGDVVVTAEAAPEPNTLLLVAPALGFAFWLRRQRRSITSC